MDIKDELMKVAQNEVEEAQPAEGIQMTEWIFANEANPALRQLFHSLYSGVFQNRIGIAHCKNTTTDKLETLIVGVQPNGEGGAQLYPLAVIIGEEDVLNWHSPDGKGGYVGPAAE